MSSLSIYFLLIPNALVCIATSCIMISDTPEGIYLFSLLGILGVALGNLWFARQHIPVVRRFLSQSNTTEWLPDFSQPTNRTSSRREDHRKPYNPRGTRLLAQAVVDPLLRSGCPDAFSRDVVMSRRRLTYDVSGKNPTLH